MYCICGLLSYFLGGIAWGQILAFNTILESSNWSVHFWMTPVLNGNLVWR
jgi:hypothetical protein